MTKDNIELENKNVASFLGTHNDKFEQLLQSLCKVHIALTSFTRNKENKFYNSKYTPLDTILEKVRPILSENNLLHMNILSYEQDKEFIETRIYHVNGAFISSKTPIKIKQEFDKKGEMKDNLNDPQKYGSSITYIKRYALCALLGITTKDEDDDANLASGINKKINRNQDFLEKLTVIADDDQNKVLRESNEKLANNLVNCLKKCTTEAELEHFKYQYKSDMNKLRKYANDLFKEFIEEAEIHKRDIIFQNNAIYNEGTND